MSPPTLYTFPSGCTPPLNADQQNEDDKRSHSMPDSTGGTHHTATRHSDAHTQAGGAVAQGRHHSGGTPRLTRPGVTEFYTDSVKCLAE